MSEVSVPNCTEYTRENHSPFYFWPIHHFAFKKRDYLPMISLEVIIGFVVKLFKLV